MSTQIPSDGLLGLDLLAKTALAGAACFMASALLLPLISEYTLVGDFISVLAIGRFGFVQTIAFLAQGIGLLALAAGIRRTTRGSWGSLVGSAFFVLSGIGTLIAAGFPIDGGTQPQTAAGTVHSLAALVTFVCAVLGMFVLTRTFKRTAPWRSYWPSSLVLALVALVLFFLPGGDDWVGLFQRIFVGVIIVWVVLVALRLRSIAGGAQTQQPPGAR